MQWHNGMPVTYTLSLLVSHFHRRQDSPCFLQFAPPQTRYTPTFLTHSAGTVTITPLHKYISEVTSTSFCTFLWVNANGPTEQTESHCCRCCYTTPMGVGHL